MQVLSLTLHRQLTTSGATETTNYHTAKQIRTSQRCACLSVVGREHHRGLAQASKSHYLKQFGLLEINFILKINFKYICSLILSTSQSKTCNSSCLQTGRVRCSDPKQSSHHHPDLSLLKSCFSRSDYFCFLGDRLFLGVVFQSTGTSEVS